MAFTQAFHVDPAFANPWWPAILVPQKLVFRILRLVHFGRLVVFVQFCKIFNVRRDTLFCASMRTLKPEQPIKIIEQLQGDTDLIQQIKDDRASIVHVMEDLPTVDQTDAEG